MHAGPSISLLQPLKMLGVYRSGLEVPTVEVRFRDLQIGASVYLGDRALPTLFNSYRNIIEDQLIQFRLMRSRKKPFPILHGVSGVLKPVRSRQCEARAVWHG